jgi:potassium channel subfamily T member 1
MEHQNSDEEGGSDDEAEDEVPWMIGQTDKSEKVIKGFPPVAPFIGVTPTLCYLLRDKKSLCCLQLAQVRCIFSFEKGPEQQVLEKFVKA